MTPPYPQGQNWPEQRAWLLARIEEDRAQLEVVQPEQLQIVQGRIAGHRAIISAAEPTARLGKGSQGYGG